MKNVATPLLVVTLGALGLFAYYQEVSQRRPVQELTSNGTVSNNPTLDLQQKCTRQVRQEFNSSGWEKNPKAGFTGHYNGAMGKCFLLIEDTSQDKQRPETIFVSKSLLDAFEGKTLADYLWHGDEVKNFMQVRPIICKVTLPSGKEKGCQSSDEFDELVKVYIQR